jgi:hypothetical protein
VARESWLRKAVRMRVLARRVTQEISAAMRRTMYMITPVRSAVYHSNWSASSSADAIPYGPNRALKRFESRGSVTRTVLETQYQYEDWTYHALSDKLALPTYAHALLPCRPTSRGRTKIILLCINMSRLWLWQSRIRYFGKVSRLYHFDWKQIVPAP